MTTELTSVSRVATSWNFVSTDDAGFETKDNNTKSQDQDLAEGTGSEQANFVWHDRRTVTSATTTDDIDMNALTDAFGVVFSVLKIKEIYIENLSTTSGQNLLIGGASSGAISTLLDGSQTAKETLHAGGIYFKTSPISGYTLIPGSEDTLRITHSGAAGDISFDIVVKGTR